MKSDVEKPQSDPTRKAASQTTNSSATTIAAGMLIFCILAAGALVFIVRAPINISASKKPSQIADEAPISITPEPLGGITVVEKMPELEPTSTGSVKAPVAQGAVAPQGYAIDLGSASSFKVLSERFAELVSLNDDQTLNALEPRVLLTESGTGLQARLLVGPISSMADAESACKSFKLPVGLPCKPREFEGELIARTP